RRRERRGLGASEAASCCTPPAARKRLHSVRITQRACVVVFGGVAPARSIASRYALSDPSRGSRYCVHEVAGSSRQHGIAPPDSAHAGSAVSVVVPSLFTVRSSILQRGSFASGKTPGRQPLPWRYET